MTDKSKLLRINTMCWLVAIIAPTVLHYVLSSTKFPWPIILPMLLLGPMLASNNLISKAHGDNAEDSGPR